MRRLREHFANYGVLAIKRGLLFNPAQKIFDASWRVCPRGIARTGQFWAAENDENDENDERDSGVDGIRVRSQRTLKVASSVTARGAS